MEFRKR
ncbi:hypothetical protein RDI58_009196 [Solanum bulbocastanum]